SERGRRKRIPAHTPSSLPSPAPRRWERRCASHRSMPCSGTTTTSSAKGSGSGLASRPPRPSARVSVRCARWRWRATPRPYLRGPTARGGLSTRSQDSYPRCSSSCRDRSIRGPGMQGYTSCSGREHLGEDGRVDVAAARHHDHGLPGEALPLCENGGERSGPARLDDDPERADGLTHGDTRLVVGDL